ncbi:MAG TPA: LuxR C-terminal-related transcriptional regulator, partial [Microlunatus sp.]|nr:LuxR C-terminal-related transcriptional regulator [Microlunatus sp.]
RASLGYAAFVVGDPELARLRLTEAARAAAAPATVRVLALGTLSLCAAEQGESALSAALAVEAMKIVNERGMESRPQSTFACTAWGSALADRGCLTEAAAVLAEGLAPRRQVPGLSPWPLLHHLETMAVVAARSGRRDDAERLLAEVELLAPWSGPSMAATRHRIDRVRDQVRARSTEPSAVGDPLTPREVEILHRLQGTQTLREIASDLYVSHNTVKTITLSVYRKLGAHSRHEAVALGRQHRAEG